MFRRTACLFALITVAGCNKGNTPATAAPASVPAVPSDPVSSYKAFLETEMPVFRKAAGIASTPPKAIDVRKTDSLVNPFVGSCKTDAMKGDLFLALELQHGWQDGQWKMLPGTGIVTQVIPTHDEHRQNLKGSTLTFEDAAELKEQLAGE